MIFAAQGAAKIIRSILLEKIHEIFVMTIISYVREFVNDF